LGAASPAAGCLRHLHSASVSLVLISARLRLLEIPAAPAFVRREDRPRLPLRRGWRFVPPATLGAGAVVVLAHCEVRHRDSSHFRDRTSIFPGRIVQHQDTAAAGGQAEALATRDPLAAATGKGSGPPRLGLSAQGIRSSAFRPSPRFNGCGFHPRSLHGHPRLRHHHAIIWRTYRQCHRIEPLG
jgi:hypothetical protein